MAGEKNKQGAGMVDVGAKKVANRLAVASAKISLGKKAFALMMTKGSPKGDVLHTAKIAGVMAAKSCPSIIPMCHPLELNKVNISFHIDKNKFMITCTAEVGYKGRTGVEMEALTAVSAAVLTIYDMMKWADKGMTVTEIKLIEKKGGKSGHYKRK